MTRAHRDEDWLAKLSSPINEVEARSAVRVGELRVENNQLKRELAEL